MQRLSMANTIVDAQRSFRRFPMVLLCALVATITAVYLTDHHNILGPARRILLTAILGIPFLLTVALVLEVKTIRTWQSWLAQVAGLFLLGVFFLTLAQEIPNSQYIRFAILLTGGHFFVAVAPFLGRHCATALWQFNKDLLLRLISSVLFTLVMFAGLSLALSAMDELLGLPLPRDIYMKLFLILGFIFHTWFFLGGIPPIHTSSTDADDFPRPLRVFAQHILSTLVVVYLAIMLTYLGKIIISGVWPSGWIGWLVSGVAVAGLLSVVLLSPLQGKAENPWIGIYFRIFHILMIPAVVMLVLAVGKRINQYGLTELRYILLILSAWMMVILVLGLWTRRIHLRLIPLSLGILSLAISMGPWSAGSLAFHSQRERLKEELTASGLFENGKLVPAQTDSMAVDRQDLTSSFEYLFSHFGNSTLDGWITSEMNDSMNQVRNNNKPRYRNHWALAKLILDELNIPEQQPKEMLITRHSLGDEGSSSAISVNGLQYVLNLKTQPGYMAAFSWGNSRGEAGLSDSGEKLLILRDGDLLTEISIGEILLDLSNKGGVGHKRSINKTEDMTFDFANENLKVRLVIYSIDFQGDGQRLLVEKMSGLLLLSEPRNLVPGPQ